MSLTGSTKKIDLLHYPAFSRFSEVTAFTTTRDGGVGEGCYDSFNLSEYSGDDAMAVAANRALLCRSVNLSALRFFIPYQTHDNRIFVVDDAFLALDPVAQRAAMQGVDALVTSVPGVGIGVTTADCVPILLYDPVKKVSAVVHAGWRGTVKRIASETVRRMASHLGSQPSDVVAVIGPSIGPEAFEVGDEVAEEFSRAGFADAVLTGFPKPHIDLWAANRQDLIGAGLLPENIETSGICTFTHHHRFFSARRLGIQSGRIVTGIVINLSP